MRFVTSTQTSVSFASHSSVASTGARCESVTRE
jgi:hypothetical protein